MKPILRYFIEIYSRCLVINRVPQNQLLFMLKLRLSTSETSKILLYGLFILLAFSLFSCTTTRNAQYFKTLQKDTTLTGFVNSEFETKIKPGDNLGISITSLSMEENVKFNSAGLVGNGGTIPAYQVRPDGNITIYRLGDIRAEGLTRRDLAAKLRNDLQPYLKEPIINVVYLNHKVTVLGEVNNPQVITMQEERITLIDALVISGDMKENAMKNRLMVIREEQLNGTVEKKVKHVNLEDHSLFSSQWYYLQPNDIVYVLPDNEKTASEEKRRRLQTTLSLAASGLSLLIIIIDRVIR